MRLSHSLALARVLLLFFSRRVLRIGVLRSGPVRAMAVLAGAVLAASCVTAAYVFLKPMGSEASVWRLLFDVTTVSMVLWIQIAFLFVKTLFLNADAMLDLSFQLPLTNRERAVAFLIYESVAVGLVACVGCMALSVASLLVLGPGALPMVFEAIVMPAVLIYLVLNLAYVLLGRLLVAVGLRKVQGPALILIMFATLIAYLPHVASLTGRVAGAYLDDQDRFVWLNALAWVSRHHGPVPVVLGFLLAAGVLGALALRLAPSDHVRHSRFVKVPVAKRARRFIGPYDLCLVRSTQTGLAVALALAVVCWLFVSGGPNPVWGLAILSTAGLYQFAATLPLRALALGMAPAWQTYVLLVKAQLVLLAVFLVPVLALTWATSAYPLGGTLSAVAGCASGVIVTTFIGIAFPAENDNPFSVFVGLSFVGCATGLLALGLGILQVPPSVATGAAVLMIAVLGWYSVLGIQSFESRRRHEKNPTDREQPPGRGTAHHHRRRPHPAVLDVHQ